ncbi:SARP family transcriptional regulator [Longispora fulva]|uniref:DNA-binding SARP family transcriptional activator/tetratricopeptide (TPR) repeat protein n=1 Tax=Longispora fulva TaxID=619741 RepID=A0A8J7GMF8_9ACTN|nr:BTAD domain-containing putative transcriptional regulator [Longispora fulva]MBG6141011.1 DNA-binding SARP family transcriptional activator/tetratricopeptide (TPR) repeat protein [Longispora fulva]GIG60720.1 SARP family transcriptional regulator [Longispora fulva]
MTVRFGLLGPVQLVIHGRSVVFSAPRHRAVLGFLLLNARRPVPPERLIDAIWGEMPPDRARGQIQVAVSALRRTLRDAGAEHVLATRPAGYVLDVAPDELDLDLFTTLAGSPDAARLREALDLWRGPALADVTAPYVEPARSRLTDQRLTVVERLAELDLAAGRHALIVDELAAWIAESPFRERLHRHLMLALHRLDRQPDALAVARDYRRLLADEHGLDPGQEFTDLERAILADDPALRPVPGPVATRPAGPAQLPSDVPDFVGRAEELARLDELFDGAGAVVISTIEGTGGVGKTALALHWAHRVRDLYPDGQLYVNLHGYSATEPVRPLDAMTGFLRALGVPGEEIPVDLAEAAALYRTLLADRRILVILDNASGPDQVRPLLPGSRGSRVVVTSRDRLAGLVARDGARLLELGVLPPDKAVELLTRVLGRRRVAAEPDAVAELAGLCGGLPLALRIAAAHLVSQPRRDIAGYNAELRAGDLLASLEVPGDELASIRGVFGHSYRALAPETARLFRLVGLLPGADLTAGAAAAMAGVPVDRAMTLLRELSDAHLLEFDGGDRFAPHDLIRVYARQLAEATDADDDRRAAAEALLHWCLATSDAAARLLYPQFTRLDPPKSGHPGFPDSQAALAWFESERGNLVSTVEYFADRAPQPAVWLLADAMRGFLAVGQHTADCLTVCRTGIRVAAAAGDQRGQAALELSLGNTARHRDLAAVHYQRALEAARSAGWLAVEAAAEGNLAIGDVNAGRLDAAIERITRAMEIARRTGQVAGSPTDLCKLAHIHLIQGRLADAADHSLRALALFREMGAVSGEANALHGTGNAYLRLGRYEEALELQTRAVELFGEVGHHFTSVALVEVAVACCALGRRDEAVAHVEAALAGVRTVGNGMLEADALIAVGDLARTPVDAMAAYDASLTLARKLDLPETRAAALLGLADSHAVLGDPARAEALAGEGLSVAVRHGFRLQECEANTRLAELRLRAGDREAAVRYSRRAVEIREQTGYRFREARTIAALAASTE